MRACLLASLRRLLIIGAALVVLLVVTKTVAVPGWARAVDQAKVPIASAMRPRPTGQRTSFLVLLADDMGWGDVHYNHGKSLTPELDAMAAAPSALRLDRHHSGSTTCSPTRATVLTGRAPERDCVDGPNVNWDSPFVPTQFAPEWPLHKNAPAFPLVAKNTFGYRTAFFGKWHLGNLQNPLQNPTHFGFDTWVASTSNQPTYDASCFCETFTPANATCRSRQSATECAEHSDNAMCMWQHVRKMYTVCGTTQCFGGHLAKEHFDLAPSWTCDLFQQPNGRPYKQPLGLMSAHHLVDRFQDFIASLPSSDTPFFAEIAFHETHIPVIASPELRRACVEQTAVCNTKVTSSMAIDYYGALYALDQAVGRVRALLRATGRAEHTLVLFSSDNGPEAPHMGGYGSTGGLRGYKRDITEGGHRVPGIIEWPAVIKANARIAQPTSTMDWVPTMLAVLNHNAPSTTDGVSLVSLAATGTAWTRPRPLFVCKSLVRAHHDALCGEVCLIDGPFKLMAARGMGTTYHAEALYNLDRDAHEVVDVKAANHALVRSMTDQVTAHFTSVVKDHVANCRVSHIR